MCLEPRAQFPQEITPSILVCIIDWEFCYFHINRVDSDQCIFPTFVLLDFRGNLTRGIVGFYKSVYTNGRGEKVPIATSKFQPTYARRAFPCFDEPSFKSTFTVTLVRPSDGYIALSNMPVKQELSQQPSRELTEVQVKICK